MPDPSGPPAGDLRPAATAGHHRGRTVVAGRTFRAVARSAAVWGVIFGGYIASSELAYSSAYPTARSRRQLADAFGGNIGVNALVGPAHVISTVAGFAEWRSIGVLGVVGAVWGLLTATRLLRGEEAAGRWELLLAGRTTRGRATALGLAGLAGGLAVLCAITAVLVVAAGRDHTVGISAGPSVLLAVAVVAGAAMFLAIGALTSQLVDSRRSAAALGAAVLGVAYALRMVADSTAGLGWLRWASPLGWVEEFRPLTGSRPLALLPVVILTVAAGGTAVLLAGRRDLATGTFAVRDAAPARLGLLSGPAGLAVRLVRPVAVGWLVAVTFFSLLIGVVAQSASGAVGGSTAVQQVVVRLGGHGSGAAAEMGLSFLVVVSLMTLVAAGQAAAVREEEAAQRVDHLLVRPVARGRWMAGRLAIAALLLVVYGVLSGVAAWVGAASQHTGVSIAAIVGAGLNTVPPAVFVLGVGALAFGLRPRWTAGVGYGLVAWSFLVEFLGGVVRANHWLLDTSVLFHVAPSPAVGPQVESAAVLCLAGVAAAVVGGVCFRRRDLTGE